MYNNAKWIDIEIGLMTRKNSQNQYDKIVLFLFNDEKKTKKKVRSSYVSFIVISVLEKNTQKNDSKHMPLQPDTGSSSI